MIQSVRHIKHTAFFAFILLLNFLVSSNIYGQITCADIKSGSGGGQFSNTTGAAGLGTYCAPVEIDWYLTLSAVDLGDDPLSISSEDFEIEIDWGDGETDVYEAEYQLGSNTFRITGSPNGRPFDSFNGDNTAFHIYEDETDGVCFYQPIATLLVDGVACPTISLQIDRPVNYWEPDDTAPGEVIIFEDVWEVCAGTEVTLTFEDVTEFNCVDVPDPFVSNVSLNDDDREVRIVYGTENDANTINNIVVDPAGGNITNPTNYDPAIFEIYPEPVQNGDNNYESLEIFVPDDAAVGEDFFVRLDVWGPCNPRADGYAPVSIQGRILIVDAPDPDPQIFDPSSGGSWVAAEGNALTFCIDEEIDFRQSPTNTENEPGDTYSWDFDNDGVFESNGAAVSESFVTAGTYTVNMRADRPSIGDCILETSFDVEIIETPQALIGYDIGGGMTTNDDPIEYCEDLGLPLEIELTDESIDKTSALTTTWEIDKINPGPTNIDDQDDGGAGIPPFDYPNNPLSLSDPGHYRVRLIIDDASTGCSTEDELDIFIYDQPVADFDFTTICEGEDTDFDAADSEIPIVVNSDAIDSYEWDFDYDGVTFNVGATGETPTQNLGSAGSYDVALRITTDKGCESDIFVQTVEVLHNPNSELEASYTNDYEGNLAGDTYTGDPICPGTLLTFTNTTDESLNDASVDPVTYELQIDSLGFIINRPIGARGEVDESVSPNIFFNDGGSIETYTIELVANSANGCSVISPAIDVDVLPGSASGFNIYDESTYTNTYDPLVNYCSPTEFFFQIDNPTENLLNSGDSLVWEVFDGSTLLGGDTISFGDPDYDKFLFEFNNDFPSIAAINYTIILQPYVDGVCVNNSQRTVRVLPKPTSDFLPADTVITCDSVTYYFEAEQPGLLIYDWQVQTVVDTLSTQNDGVDFWVSYARPDIGDPAVNVEVRLQTENPFNCQSDLSDPFNDTILPKDDIDIVLDTVGNEFCAPSTFGFVNNTTDPVPAGTEWELIIKNLDINDSTVVQGTSLVGNEDFSASTPEDIFEYEFTDSANYEIRLNALLPSTCDVTSDPPISINIGETPEISFRTNISQGCAPLDVSIIAESSALPSGRNFNLSYEVRKPNGDLVSNGGPIVKGPSDPNGYNNFSLPTLQNTETDSIDYEVTLIGESFAGCISDSTIIVRVYQQPEIDFDIISPNPACQENYDFEFEIDPAVLNVPPGTNFIWNWGDGQTLTTDQDTIVNHLYSNRAAFFGPDSYNVSLTAETPNGCNITVNKTVDLNPQVSASFFKDRIEGCSPLNVNFTSTALGTGLNGNHIYERRIKDSGDPWQTFNTAPQPNGAVSENFENTSAADIIYEIRYIAVSSAGGCSDTSNIQEIKIFPEFNSPAIVGPTEVCAFSQAVEYSVPFTTGSTYIWQLPLGAFISNQNADGNEIEVNFSNFSGDIQVQEIDANGCFGQPSTQNINVLTGPSANIALNGPNVICPGDDTSLIFDLTGPGTQGFDVIYNNGQENDTLFNISDGHIETVSPANSTNYFLVGVIDREFPSCNNSGLSGSVFINVNTPPTATISGSTTICEGENTNLIINLTGVGPWDVVYTDGNNNYNLNTNNPVTIASVSPSDDTDYEIVSITDNNTPVCSGTFSGLAEITVNPKPTAEIFGNVNDVCQNDPTEIGVNLTGTAPWTVRYTDGSTTFTLANITPDTSYDPATDTYTHLFDVSPISGTTTYTLTEVIDSSSPVPCRGDISGSATVIAYDRPQVELTGDTTICLGQSTPLSFRFTGDGPFQGNYTANSDTIAFSNLQNNESINVTPNQSTVYRVVELFDTRGCAGQNLGGPVSINVNQLPTSEISGADTTCYREETNLIFDQTGVGPWEITYTDGSQNYTFTTAFNRHFEPVSPDRTTDYTLVSVTDSNNPNSCSGQVSGSVRKFVYPELQVSFDVNPQNMVLPESTINLTNNTTNKEEWDYLWEFGDGTTSTEADPAPYDYGTFGEFTVRLTATNGLCTDTYQTIVTIGAIPPIVDFDADPKEGCIPLVVQFENLTEYADPSTYQWEFGDGQRASAVENPIHVYTNPGTYTVTLSASNITGQRTEMVKEEFITVNATPQASFTIPDEYRQVFTTEEVRFVNLSEGADEFIWKFGDGNESFEEEPIHAYADSGVYNITLIAINTETGCTDSVSLSSQVQVILGGESDVPNAFTPSRAGPGTGSSNPLQNDFFLPRVEGVSQFNMKIYNRWGELLFESKDKDEGWDGYYNGVLMPQGVYVYRLELVYENGRRETKVGDVTLIR